MAVLVPGDENRSHLATPYAEAAFTDERTRKAKIVPTGYPLPSQPVYDSDDHPFEPP